MSNKYFNYTVLVVCTACLLATSVDIPLSWTSPIFPKLKSNDTSDNPFGRPITDDEDGWMGSLLTVGAVIGPFPFSFITEKFGRKIGLLSTSIPITVSFFMLAFAQEIWIYYFARILGGLSMGAGYALLPIYVAEISEDHNRGVLSQLLNIFWSLGSFLSYVIGPFVSIKVFNIAIGCIPTIFFFAFLILAPESPYYLVSDNKLDKAAKSIALLRNESKEKIEEQIEKIKGSLKKDEEESSSFLELIRNKAVIKALIICSVLIMTQELCGFVAILFYMEMIFKAAGSDMPSEISSLIVAVFLLTSSFVNPFFIDRSGRRLLTIVSCSGMAIALTLLGVFFFLKDSTSVDSDPISWLPLLSLILYIFSFNFGISSIPWTLTSELFPTNIKNVASNYISILCWSTSFIVTKFFNSMTEHLKNAGTFWMFAGFCFLAGIFSLFFVPETKGKSFSNIQDMLLNGGFIQLGALKKRRNREQNNGKMEFVEIAGINTSNKEKY